MIDQAQESAAAAATVVAAPAVVIDFPRKTVLGMIFALLALCAGAMLADVLGWLPSPGMFG